MELSPCSEENPVDDVSVSSPDASSEKLTKSPIFEDPESKSEISNLSEERLSVSGESSPEASDEEPSPGEIAESLAGAASWDGEYTGSGPLDPVDRGATGLMLSSPLPPAISLSRSSGAQRLPLYSPGSSLHHLPESPHDGEAHPGVPPIRGGEPMLLLLYQL